MSYKVTALQDVNVRGIFIVQRQVGNSESFKESIPAVTSILLKKGESQLFDKVKDVSATSHPLESPGIPHPEEIGAKEIYNNLIEIERAG